MSDLISKGEVLRMIEIHPATFARWCRDNGLEPKKRIGNILSFSRSEVVAILDKKEKEQEPPPGYLPIFKVIDLLRSDEKNVGRLAKRLGIQSVQVGRRVFYNEAQVLAAVPLVLARSKKEKPKNEPGNEWISRKEAVHLLSIKSKNFKGCIANNSIEEKDGRYNLAQVLATAQKIKARRVEQFAEKETAQIDLNEIVDILGIKRDNVLRFCRRFGLEKLGAIGRLPIYDRAAFMLQMDKMKADIAKSEKQKTKPSPAAAKFLEYARRVKNEQ